MPDLSATSLSADERALLERFAVRLREHLGPALHAIWLFGSRARGEPPAHEDSDVDLLVLVADDSWDAKIQVARILDQAARDLDLQSITPWFIVHVHTPAWLAGRREINSFFIAEVDRDRVVVEGSE